MPRGSRIVSLGALIKTRKVIVNDRQLKIAKRFAWILVGLNIFDLVVAVRRVVTLNGQQPELPESENSAP
jgi:hypothetical protein